MRFLDERTCVRGVTWNVQQVGPGGDDQCSLMSIQNFVNLLCQSLLTCLPPERKPLLFGLHFSPADRNITQYDMNSPFFRHCQIGRTNGIEELCIYG